jgi:hypothetical protein
MNTYETDLLDLAREVGRHAPPSSPRGREVLESTLVPIIRVALRTGRGPAPLVRWVRSQVGPHDWRSDPTAAARPLARALCDRLLDRLDPLPCRETLVGA